MSLTLEDKKSLFEKRLNKRLTFLASIRDAGTISASEYNRRREKILDEEIEKIEEEDTRKEDGLFGLSYHPDELAREPFIKDLLRQKDLWKRHKAAIEADQEGWETAARETFISTCKANLASPLIVMLGEFLIMQEDKEDGRRKLIEILLLQDAEERTKIFNWLQLGKGPQGTEMIHGKKVEQLSFPLFSYKHSDLAQRNSQILSGTPAKNSHGGSTDETSVRGMYLEEGKVLLGGSIPFPVVDAQGTPSGYYVDMEPVHNAFIGLERSVRSHDGQETLHLSILKKLLASVSPSTNNQHRRYDFSHVGRGEKWSPSYRPQTRGNFQNGRYRGGEASSEPKNEYSPS